MFSYYHYVRSVNALSDRAKIYGPIENSIIFHIIQLNAITFCHKK